MIDDRLPRHVVDAVRAFAAAVVAGPKECACDGSPGWNNEEDHSEGCAWVHAGLVEHHAERAMIRVIRTWAKDSVGSEDVGSTPNVCGAVGDPLDVRTPWSSLSPLVSDGKTRTPGDENLMTCALKPGHVGEHRALSFTTVEIKSISTMAQPTCLCGHPHAVHKGHVCYGPGASNARRCRCGKFEPKKET